MCTRVISRRGDAVLLPHGEEGRVWRRRLFVYKHVCECLSHAPLCPCIQAPQPWAREPRNL